MQNNPSNNSIANSGQEPQGHSRWISSIGQELQETYMKQVSSFPTLSPEEEASLTKEYGEAKLLLISTLRKYPSIFIDIIKSIRKSEASCRITNYFTLDDYDAEDENDIRSIFMMVSSRIISVTAGKGFPYPDNNTYKAEEFWDLFVPLIPRQFLFKKACIMLKDPNWRKKVLTDKEWNECQHILAQTQDTMAKIANTLVEHNLRLVISIAGRYMNCGIQLQDLVQEGNIGLMRSIERFDHTLGHRFSTYASYWIRQAITRSITNHSRIIRMPANTVTLISQIRREEQHYLNETGEMPTPDILAQKLGITPAKVRALQEMVQQPISLHSIVSEDKALIDTIADQNCIKPSDCSDFDTLKDAVSKLLDVLTDRERKIISMHFGINGEEQQTLTAISRIMGLSRERIRQLEIRALHKLRMPSAMKLLEGFNKNM